MAQVLTYPHIVRDPQRFDGWPYLEGTRVRVVDVASWYKAGLSAEQTPEQFPAVSKAAVFAGLAYYHDHQAEIEAQLTAMDRDWQAGKSQANVPAKFAEAKKRKQSS